MLIKSLRLKNILSFIDTTVELGPLNVLIGPNAAGKSNLIEVISLLQAAPASILSAIRRGGGVSQWISLSVNATGDLAEIVCEFDAPDPSNYQLQFMDSPRGFSIVNESLSASETGEPYFKLSQQELSVSPFNGSSAGFLPSSTESFFAQFRDPFDRTPVSRIGKALSGIQIYREFRTNLQSPTRYGTSTTASQKDLLADGGDNLAMVLQEIHFHNKFDSIQDNLRRFCDRFEDVKLAISEGLVRPFLVEKGLKDRISGPRMSDGTLKFLCLLAVLLHPDKPPLICIEEPEIGLHPDALAIVAEALLEASQQTQIIVTTHSESFVDALSDIPENLLVCERGEDNGTEMKRLDRAGLEGWLQHYSLGQLWRKGEIGGNRW